MANLCPQCQHNNPDNIAECQSCGAKIAAPCRNCGAINPLSSKYCGECGELAQVPATPKPAVVPAPPESVVAPIPTEEAVVTPIPKVEETAKPVPPVAEAPPPRPSAPPTNIPSPPMATPEKSPSNVPGTRLQIAQAILVHLGSQERVELPIGKNLVFLGKPNNEIPPDIDVMRFAGSEIVSRIHALIHNVNDEAFYLEDAGSSNGTFLNDEPIKAGTRWRKRLQSGDTIALGKGGTVSFRFEIEE